MGRSSHSAASHLPEGGPSGRGIPLDSDIPGTKTHVKDEDAGIREFDAPGKSLIFHVEYADDLLKDSDGIGERTDNADATTSTYGGNWDSSSKTKYPYRSGLPHTHSASQFVAECYAASCAPTLRHTSGARAKIALNMGGVTEGLNPDVINRARQCKVRLKRADLTNRRWILVVDCGNVPRVVKIKAFRTGNISALSRLDLDLQCSCPAWRWLGSEHHAKREDYLDGKPRGTASVPVIRDPTGVNRVCKHVFSALEFVGRWDVRKKKPNPEGR